MNWLIKIGICTALIVVVSYGTWIFVQNKNKTASEMCSLDKYAYTVVVCENGDYIVNHESVAHDGTAHIYDKQGNLLKEYGGFGQEKLTEQGKTRMSYQQSVGCDPYKAKVVCNKTK